MKAWHLQGDQLGITDGGSFSAVDATSIYSSVVEGERVIDGIEPGKSGDADALRFSRYPAYLTAAMETRSAENLPVVVLSIRTQTGASHPVSMQVLQSGHATAGGSWYAIDPESLEDVRAQLKSAGVRNSGRVPTLGGILKLKSAAAGEASLIEDRLPAGSDAALRFVPAETGAPKGVDATLYPYQQDGWRWLKFVIGQDVGGLLADEMGLGKTLQIISVLADCGSRKLVPALVIAPGSLLENWRREITKFAPGLKMLKHHGVKRSGRFADLQACDVIVTSYDTAVSDLSMLKMVDWSVVILDEAQNIKTPDALRTKSVKAIPRKVSLAMTGTPLENRLTDLWSIMDFVSPGYLGDLNSFSAHHDNTVDGAASVEPLISPLMLRRRVAEVAKDLPERIDIPEVIQLSDREAAEYERIRQEIFNTHGAAATLVSLTKLRQFCAHPAILGEAAGADPAAFSKFARLLEILAEIAAEGDKALVFTSFTEMADMIARNVEIGMGVFAGVIDGRLPIDARQPLVDRFSEVEGPAVLVLNPRAGGAGLNITAATHVIHYNLEWNPALEDQASARAHRRGQTRPVTVRRMFCADTVEDVVNDRIQSKRSISDAAVVGVQGHDEDYPTVIAALERSPVGGGRG